jgi:hypothetical protein
LQASVPDRPKAISPKPGIRRLPTLGENLEFVVICDELVARLLTLLE